MPFAAVRTNLETRREEVEWLLCVALLLGEVQHDAAPTVRRPALLLQVFMDAACEARPGAAEATDHKRHTPPLVQHPPRSYHASMAQLIVRNLEDSIRDRLRDLAEAHGRSMEEEVREILRAAVLAAAREKRPGLGTEISQLFRGAGLDEEIAEHKIDTPKPAEFDA